MVPPHGGRCDGCCELVCPEGKTEELCVFTVRVDVFHHVISLCHYCTRIGKHVILDIFSQHRDALSRGAVADVMPSIAVWTRGKRTVFRTDHLLGESHLPLGDATTLCEIPSRFFSSLADKIQPCGADSRPIHRAVMQAEHLFSGHSERLSVYRSRQQNAPRVCSSDARSQKTVGVLAVLAVLAMVLLAALPEPVRWLLAGLAVHVFLSTKRWTGRPREKPRKKKQEVPSPQAVLLERIDSMCSVDNSYWSWKDAAAVPRGLKGVELKDFLCKIIAEIEMQGAGGRSPRKAAKLVLERLRSSENEGSDV